MTKSTRQMMAYVSRKKKNKIMTIDDIGKCYPMRTFDDNCKDIWYDWLEDNYMKLFNGATAFNREITVKIDPEFNEQVFYEGHPLSISQFIDLTKDIY